MTDKSAVQPIRTRIWQEEPEPDNPFAARAAYCRGYDVFGQMLGKARWVEMLALLFRDELPSPASLDTLEALAVALANPGPRDQAVHAAMCGSVGGSTAAACLMAALAVGAGQFGGGREVFLAMEFWAICGTDLEAWRRRIATPPTDTVSIWPQSDHVPGFNPHGVSPATTVRQALDCLAKLSPGPYLPWLSTQLPRMEAAVGRPLALTGVAAATLVDLGFTPEEGEMLHLLLRLPGAAAHALEQRRYGHKKFPFFAVELATEEDTP